LSVVECLESKANTLRPHGLRATTKAIDESGTRYAASKHADKDINY